MIKLPSQKKSSSIDRLIPSHFSIPLITTNPVTDIGILIGLTPVWWFMGIEQLIWPFVFGWVALKVFFIKKGKVVFTGVMKVFILFLIIQLISAFSLTELYSWIVFIRNFSVFLIAFFLIFILSNSIHEWSQLKWLLKVAVIVMGVSSFIGILGTIGVWRPNYVSPLTRFLPTWVFQSGAVNNIANRSIGHLTTFLSIQYFRIDGFFLYPTLYATTLISIIPVAIFLSQIDRQKISRIVWTGIAGILLFNLLSTTGRAATISFIAGFLFLQLFIVRKDRVLRWSAILLVIVLILISLTQKEILNSIFEFFSTRSSDERLNVYSQSFEMLAQRPLFGWGTARNIDSLGVSLPLGSHSYYIAMLFRFGLVGFFVFALMYWMLWYQTRTLQLKEFTNIPLKEMNMLLNYGRWIIIALLLDGAATIPITDLVTMTLVWLIYSSLLVTRRLAISEIKDSMSLKD